MGLTVEYSGKTGDRDVPADGDAFHRRLKKSVSSAMYIVARCTQVWP